MDKVDKRKLRKNFKKIKRKRGKRELSRGEDSRMEAEFLGTPGEEFLTHVHYHELSFHVW